MPTARELLEEVDALMRRNRAGPETITPPAPAHEVIDDPVAAPDLEIEDTVILEPPVEEALEVPVLDDIPILTDVAHVEERAEPSDRVAAPAAVEDDLPLLTDVADFETPPDEDEPLIGGLPAEAFSHVSGTIAAAVPVAPPPQSRIAKDDPRWNTLAEDIRMQVLQRLDLFTERGLQSQLEAHLQPIVNRASAELVQTINTHLGEVLRAYVAEAIEREIEKWRHDTQ